MGKLPLGSCRQEPPPAATTSRSLARASGKPSPPSLLSWEKAASWPTWMRPRFSLNNQTGGAQAESNAEEASQTWSPHARSLDGSHLTPRKRGQGPQPRPRVTSEPLCRRTLSEGTIGREKNQKLLQDRIISPVRFPSMGKLKTHLLRHIVIVPEFRESSLLKANPALGPLFLITAWLNL